MASSTAHVIKRSLTLLLIQVRISICLPSQFPYTSRSLFAFLSLSSLFIGGVFHGSGSLLSCSKYRLSGREGRAVCRVAISFYLFEALIYDLRLSYMPCGLLTCVFVCQGTPNDVCTTHIVAKQ